MLCDHILMKLKNNWETHKYVEIKQHTLNYAVGPRSNRKGNQKILGDGWKWRHNKPTFMGYAGGDS